jgi:hypothetical protein
MKEERGEEGRGKREVMEWMSDASREDFCGKIKMPVIRVRGAP